MLDVYDSRVVRLPTLRVLRTRQALTQEELADRAGITRATLSRIEAELQDARPSTVRKLAKALGVKPSDLMEPAQ